eukprot:1887540-Pleurochrysis_carterae.AAC.1
MLAQLQERSLVEKLGDAVGKLVAHADEVRLDRAVELALAEVVIPALVVLTAQSSSMRQRGQLVRQLQSCP